MDHRNSINLQDYHLMLTKLFQAQGQFEGLFSSSMNAQVQETFSIIFRKISPCNIFEIGQLP